MTRLTQVHAAFLKQRGLLFVHWFGLTYPTTQVMLGQSTGFFFFQLGHPTQSLPFPALFLALLRHRRRCRRRERWGPGMCRFPSSSKSSSAKTVTGGRRRPGSSRPRTTATSAKLRRLPRSWTCRGTGSR